MATSEELYAAIRLISKHCALQGDECTDCPLLDWCEHGENSAPDRWPDPEEGGGEDG